MIYSFLLATVLAAPPAQAAITIDATKKTPISPYIYGANFIDWQKMKLPFPFVRQGGNRMTAYNWETNASNAGNDFHHQNDNYMGDSSEPAWNHKSILQPGQAHGAAVLLTIPTLGYVSADKKGDGDVAKTPNYLETRFFKSYPSKPSGKVEFPPNLNDRAVYQDELVAYLERIKSPKTPVWYSLDNEPDLWANTHARICPKPLTYQGIIDNNTAYATAIKRVAPKTLVFGPANYGWYGFRRFQGASDANDRDFLDVYMAAMNAAGKKAGRRLLDVLDIHWYPEAKGDGVRITWGGGPDKPGTPAARIQATRSLWDPTYVEDSWITKDFTKGKPIGLLPGIQAQIAKHYPGTKLSITEYSYGGTQHVSGALAQADALGLFGRYGLFAAANWGVGAEDTATMAGFRAFLNFDGKGAKFGDLGLAVSGERAAENAVYAALDSKDPKRLTVVAINKTERPMPTRLALKGFAAKSCAGWAVTAESLAVSKPVGGAARSGTVTFIAPPLSVTSLVVRR